MKKLFTLGLVFASAMALTACSGENGLDGTNGKDGVDGKDLIHTYEDGNYRGSYATSDVSEVRFSLVNNEIVISTITYLYNGCDYKTLLSNDLDLAGLQDKVAGGMACLSRHGYTTSTTEEGVAAIVGRYNKDVTNYQGLKDKINGLKIKANGTGLKAKVGEANLVTEATSAGHSLRTSKLLSAIQDGLNRGLY